MRQLALLGLVFAALFTVPFVVESESWRTTIIMTLYAALLGQAWNILGGYGGQFSFGHAAFFGTGAYTVAVLQVQFGINPWLGLVAGGALACAAPPAVATMRRSAPRQRGGAFAGSDQTTTISAAASQRS